LFYSCDDQFVIFTSGGLQIEILVLPEVGPETIQPTTHMHSSLVSQVKLLVGILESSVVFLDHDGWLSTWDITSASADDGLTRHSFAPKDWLNNKTSHLSVIDKGALFVPKYENVAIVRGGMRQDYLTKAQSST
jgi:hypothetical protein